jgi:hypothetical protein
MQASSPDVDRRVTFDRAVWTKPLALAADAAPPLWALNRASRRRRGVHRDDGGPIEAVKTSPAGGDRMFMDAVAAERTHLRARAYERD